MSDRYKNLVGLADFLSMGNEQDLFEAVVRNKDKVFPISPAKIVVLLAQALADQGSEALAISPAQCREAAAARSSEIAERCAAEFDNYASAYVVYLKKRSALEVLQYALSFLASCAVLVAEFACVPLAAAYLRDLPHIRFLSYRGTVLILFITAIAVVFLGEFAAKKVWYRIGLMSGSLEPTARVLHQRLLDEFQAIVVDLVWKTSEHRSDPLLHSGRAPTLVEIESARVVPSKTFYDVLDFLRLHVTSAVGIAGHRGAGKSTLLRWLTYSLDPEWVTVYLPTPATYNAPDFSRMIFRATVGAVLASYQYKTPTRVSRIRNVLTVTRRALPASEEIVRMSSDALKVIGMSRADQWITTGGFSAKSVSIQRQKQTTLTERDLTHPELVAAFRQYLEDYRRLGGRRVVIGIDELDKLATADEATAVINSLKDLFHLPNTHFVVSVSDDALVRFAMRGIPFRDVFDSAFDNVFQVAPPSVEDAWKLLARRAGRFPISAAMFCYAWSGGMPRDLIRTARACVDIRRHMHMPVSVRELAEPVVRNDLRELLNAAVTAELEENSMYSIEILLSLRYRVDDESIALDGALEGLDLRRGLEGGADPGQVSMLDRLASYIDLGRAIASYFRSGIDSEIAQNFDEVVSIVGRFARAKLALAVYPPEAKRFLSEALEIIEGSGDRQRRE